MNQDTLTVGVFVFGIIVGWACAYLVGYHYGVKDTEQRWHDAVRRREN